MALLVIAGVVVFVINSINGYRIVGHALADWPAPPPVGSCIGVPDGGKAIVVPCTGPHLQEVTRTFGATDPRRNHVERHWDEYCAGANSTYLGSRPDDTRAHGPDGEAIAWRIPQPQVAYGLLRAPAGDRRGEVGWLACIVRPQGAVAYTGSIRAIGRSPDRPAAFQRCGSGTESNVGYSGVSCTQPHDWQLLGEWQGPSAWGLSADGQLARNPQAPDARQLKTSCTRFASRILDVRDPTYGGELAVDVVTAFQGSLRRVEADGEPPGVETGARGPETTEGPVPDDTSFTALASTYGCRIAPADARLQLADGMEHWGDRVPPLRSGD